MLGRLLFAALLLGLLLCAAPASAQLPMTHAGPGAPSTGGFICPNTWCGVGDIKGGATDFWGFRAYSFATGGNKAVNVCNVSDVVCADLSTSASTGQLVITTIGGSNCAIVTCTVKTLYGQANSNDATQATIAQRPVFVTSCQNSLPCMSCTAGSVSNLVIAGITTVSQPLTYSVVVEQTAGAGARAAWVGTGSSGNAEAGFDPTAGKGYMYANGAVPTANLTTGAWHAVQTVFDTSGTGSKFYADGVSTSLNPGTQGLTNTLQICDSANGALSGNVAELTMWSSANSATDNSRINSQQHTWWGF